MKLDVFRSAVVLNAIFFLVPCFAGDNIREMTLDWRYKPEGSEVSFNFQRVQFIRGFLRFDIIAHNMDTKHYKCIFITAGEKTIHMDDEDGNEYKGATVMFKGGLDNKLALNQRKEFIVSIPAPKKDVSVVNLHFGLLSRNIPEKSTCRKPLGNHGYNFHQLKWDVSWIR